MTTLHATHKRSGDGWVAMVTIRLPNGTMRGSVVASKPVFHPAFAKAQAAVVARQVAARLNNVTVRV